MAVNPAHPAHEQDMPRGAQQAELITITVASKVPDFWAERPRLWFVQLEAVIANQRLSDESKYHLTIAKLSKSAIEQVSDILLTPPNSNKYETLKGRLIEVYEDSENKQLMKLLNETELGGQKPSQLLRRMKELSRGKIPDPTLQLMWSGHLPDYVRAVLAITETASLDKLATVADKIMEASEKRHHEVAGVSGAAEAAEHSLAAQVAALTSSVARLQASQAQRWRRGRSRSRQRNGGQRRGSGQRQGSGHRGNWTPRTPASPDWLCVAHYRYGERAHNCTQPCAWAQQKKTTHGDSAGN